MVCNPRRKEGLSKSLTSSIVITTRAIIRCQITHRISRRTAEQLVTTKATRRSQDRTTHSKADQRIKSLCKIASAHRAQIRIPRMVSNTDSTPPTPTSRAKASKATKDFREAKAVKGKPTTCSNKTSSTGSKLIRTGNSSSSLLSR